MKIPKFKPIPTTISLFLLCIGFLYGPYETRAILGILAIIIMAIIFKQNWFYKKEDFDFIFRIFRKRK